MSNRSKSDRAWAQSDPGPRTQQSPSQQGLLAQAMSKSVPRKAPTFLSSKSPSSSVPVQPRKSASMCSPSVVLTNVSCFGMPLPPPPPPPPFCMYYHIMLTQDEEASEFRRASTDAVAADLYQHKVIPSPPLPSPPLPSPPLPLSLSSSPLPFPSLTLLFPFFVCKHGVCFHFRKCLPSPWAWRINEHFLFLVYGYAILKYIFVC